MRTNKILSILLVCTLCWSLLGGVFPAYADSSAVAEIAGTDYSTLTEALKAAGSEDTVTLLSDITESVSYTVTTDKTIIIDGNNKKITGVSPVNPSDYSAALTLQGTGTIKLKDITLQDINNTNPNNSCGLYIPGNVSVLNGGTVKAQGGNNSSGGSYGVYNIGTGTVNINEAAGGSAYTHSIGACNSGNGTINVRRASGGSSNTNSFGVRNQGAGTVNASQAVSDTVNKDWTCGVDNAGSGTVNVETAAGGSYDSEAAVSYGVLNSGAGTVNVKTATGYDITSISNTSSGKVNTGSDVTLLRLQQGTGVSCVLDEIAVATAGLTTIGTLPNAARDGRYSNEWYTDSARTTLYSGTTVNGGTDLYSIFVEDVYSININSPAGGSIISDRGLAKAGDTVNLIVTPDNGKQLQAGSLKYNDGTDHVLNGTSFIMPAANVVISAVFEWTAYIKYGDVVLTGSQISYFDASGAYKLSDMNNEDVIRIVGDGTPVQHHIVASQGSKCNTYTIILQNVNLDLSGQPEASTPSAFTIFPYTTVNLQLEGTNSLKSGPTYAGLLVSKDAILNFVSYKDNSGTLTATGGQYGAGIGNGDVSKNGSIYGDNAGTINLNYYHITAYGGLFGAGIGGGYYSAGGTITVNGGTITAMSGAGGAAIGGGGNGSGGHITINAGTVTATRANDQLTKPVMYDYPVITSASIGGGMLGAGGTITINGGNITTNSYSAYLHQDQTGIDIYDYGTGIGGGSSGNGGIITIYGGEINETGYNLGAGIGGGYGYLAQAGNGGTVLITGGKITARSLDGAGIGGGGSAYMGLLNGQYIMGGNGGTVTITGGEINASSISGAGIGGGYAPRSTGGDGGNLLINGGTVRASSSKSFGIGAGGYTDSYSYHGLNEGACKIDGGSVCVTGMGPAVTNSNSIRLYPAIASLSGISSATEVSCSVDGGSSFTCTTDSNGQLYLWLPLTVPNSTTKLTVTCSGIDTYYACNVTNSDNTFAEGHLLTAPTITLSPDITHGGLLYSIAPVPSETSHISNYTIQLFDSLGSAAIGNPISAAALTGAIPLSSSIIAQASYTAKVKAVAASSYLDSSFSALCQASSAASAPGSNSYTVSIGTLSGGSITASPTSASSRDVINLTVIPDSGKRLKPGSLKYNYGNQDIAIIDSSFIMPAANVTISGEFENISTIDIDTSKSTAVINPLLAANSTSVVTVTLKDANGNLLKIASIGLKIIVTIADTDLTTSEHYNVAGQDCTTTNKIVNIADASNDSGQITFTVKLPAAIDTGDGLSVQVKTSDDRSIGSSFCYPVTDECFIATAAFGSKLQPAVVLLRQFRDKCLLTNTSGQEFVKFYYRNSPPVARFISQSEPLKIVVRVLLLPLITIAYVGLHPELLGLVAGLILLLVLWRRKVRNKVVI